MQPGSSAQNKKAGDHDEREDDQLHDGDQVHDAHRPSRRYQAEDPEKSE